MTGKSHIMLGTAVGIMLQINHPSIYSIPAVGLTIIGSMAPDLDHVRSKIGRKLPIISSIISFLFGHRKFLHSPLIVLLMWGAFYQSELGLAFVAGYICHLIQDFCTKGGIPLFYPYKKRFALPIAKTGGLMEYILTGAMICAAIFVQL